jgi:hypothetical protein
MGKRKCRRAISSAERANDLAEPSDAFADGHFRLPNGQTALPIRQMRLPSGQTHLPVGIPVCRIVRRVCRRTFVSARSSRLSAGLAKFLHVRHKRLLVGHLRSPSIQIDNPRAPVLVIPLFAVVPSVVIQNSFINTYIFNSERNKK